MVEENWDTKTADHCQLQTIIPTICEDCRDFRYCHNKQMSFEDLWRINDVRKSL